ncbi:hydrolase [Tersicoccus sp. Bi-70]|nr:hydrolase [Tersicoccus sp. Bi-70]
MHDRLDGIEDRGRILLKGGHVVDPANDVDRVTDIAVDGGHVVETGDDLAPEPGDRILDCEGLLVVPGLIDIHLHLGDLFEVSTQPIFEATQDGVTFALSPGAGNTLMAPALLGAEVDRGLPINLGVFIGAANLLGTMLSVDEIITMLKGELDPEIATTRMTRNPITALTAPLCIGIKDHMGHFIQADDRIDAIYRITSEAGLLYMSHTQDPTHAERVVSLSNGRPVHLGHATAAGSGSHGDPVESMARVLALVEEPHVSAEFVTSMLRPSLGSREGLKMTKASQQLAMDALHRGDVDILISDGQLEATMKGFGDTRDNIPAILEVAESGVLTLSRAVATMTANPARLLSERTRNPWWTEKTGHLGAGALGNVTVINQHEKRAIWTLVNGEIVAFESRSVRRGAGAGGWVSRWGMVRRTGVGDLVAFDYRR